MLALQAVSRFLLHATSSSVSATPQLLAVAQWLAKPDKDINADPYTGAASNVCAWTIDARLLAVLKVKQTSPNSVGGAINLNVSPSRGIASHFLDAHSFPVGAELSHSSGILECY